MVRSGDLGALEPRIQTKSSEYSSYLEKKLYRQELGGPRPTNFGLICLRGGRENVETEGLHSEDTEDVEHLLVTSQ